MKKNLFYFVSFTLSLVFCYSGCWSFFVFEPLPCGYIRTLQEKPHADEYSFVCSSVCTLSEFIQKLPAREIKLAIRRCRTLEPLLTQLMNFPKSQITSLDLGYNFIGYEGAKAIATALPQSKLTSLDLGYNRIGDEGAKAIATALPQSKLTSLDLGYNRIGGEGAKAIATALHNLSLLPLNLGTTI